MFRCAIVYSFYCSIFSGVVSSELAVNLLTKYMLFVMVYVFGNLQRDSAIDELLILDDLAYFSRVLSMLPVL